MLDAGDAAPDFYLPAVTDPEAEFMLSSAATAGPVVLAFVSCEHPDGQSVLEELARTDWAALVDRIAVFGIDHSQASAETIARLELPFPVLDDSGGYVTEQYGLDTTAGGCRGLILSDGRCTIRWAWESSQSDAEPPLGELEREVRTLGGRR